jgi:hypothetical protein
VLSFGGCFPFEPLIVKEGSMFSGICIFKQYKTVDKHSKIVDNYSKIVDNL